MFGHTSHYALRARYVLPVEAPPLANGIVVVDHGQIQQVTTTPPAGRCPVIDLGNAVIMPGLVNAHVHLDFSHHQTPLGRQGMPFSEWLNLVIQQRRDAPPVVSDTLRRKSISAGLRECRRHGTTTLANIARDDELALEGSREASCVSLLELIGLSAEKSQAQCKRLYDWLARAQSAFSRRERWRPGISPHAPYTARRETIAVACEVSRSAQILVAMHLAESHEELELLDSQSGPLVDVLRRYNAWDASAFRPSLRPHDYLELLAEADRALVIHGNYLDTEDHAWLGKHADRMAVVYCPRTHRYFGHPRYPLSEMLAAGVTVALGTDGHSTNPDLSLLAEMRHIAGHHPDVSPSDIVRLATLSGAAALGYANRTGSLRPGKDADLAVIPLPESAEGDPFALLLSSQHDVKMTVYRGRIVHPRVRRIETR